LNRGAGLTSAIECDLPRRAMANAEGEHLCTVIGASVFGLADGIVKDWSLCSENIWLFFEPEGDELGEISLPFSLRGLLGIDEIDEVLSPCPNRSRRATARFGSTDVFVVEDAEAAAFPDSCFFFLAAASAASFDEPPNKPPLGYFGTMVISPRRCIGTSIHGIPLKAFAAVASGLSGEGELDESGYLAINPAIPTSPNERCKGKLISKESHMLEVRVFHDFLQYATFTLGTRRFSPALLEDVDLAARFAAWSKRVLAFDCFGCVAGFCFGRYCSEEQSVLRENPLLACKSG
jgi:hypothetical protein